MITATITIRCTADSQAELYALRHAAHQAVAAKAKVLRSSVNATG